MARALVTPSAAQPIPNQAIWLKARTLKHLRGYSKPTSMDFIQEVEMKTPASLLNTAALWRRVNVVLKKGSNDFHGEFSLAMNPRERTRIRSMPSCATTRLTAVTLHRLDPEYSSTKRKRPFPHHAAGCHRCAHRKDKVWFIAGFNPLVNSATERSTLQ